MNILIIGPNSWENRSLILAAKKYGHRATRASINCLSFILEKNKFNIYYKAKNVLDFDICLIRGINPHFAKAKTLAKHLNRHHIPVVDKELYKKVYSFDKIFMYSALSFHGVPCLDTYYYFSCDEWRQSKYKFEYPIIIKDIHGMHGRNIHIISTEKKFQEFIRNNPIKKYFVQKFINSDYYYRVLVIDGLAIGALKRYTLKVTRSKQIPLAQRAFASNLTPKMKKIAEMAAKATNADIAGVDIIFDEKEQPYVLEVNRSPQFKRFVQKNKIDVPGKIIQYLESLV